MSSRQVVILHGWSDASKSFYPLSRFLSANGYRTKLLWLGDYISKDDDVRVEDVGRRMAEVIEEMTANGDLDPSFDMIVHSTGGLVAREWITTRYRESAEKCPVKRLVMLAPANYGSKLAATGKSFLGRVIKGYDNWFESGRSMLNDLELASPYQWELAQRDVLALPDGPVTKYYGADLVWPFVITGTRPYADLFRKIVNENGSDGTVRVCAANLNARGYTVDFSGKEPLVREWPSRLECPVPLAVLPTRTHGSIVDPEREAASNRESILETPEQMAMLGKCILQALGCADFAEYQKVLEEWDLLSEETANQGLIAPEPDFYHQYLQINTYVTDNYGRRVPDYFVEFYSNPKTRSDPADVYLQSEIIEDVKKNTTNDALRNFYFDRTDLVNGYYERFEPDAAPAVYMSISAANPGDNVTYFDRQAIGASGQIAVHLKTDEEKRRFRRNTTHFLQIVIPRIPKSDVFRLVNASTLPL